jgi:hypothetical protein
MHGWNGNICAVFEAYAFVMPANARLWACA